VTVETLDLFTAAEQARDEALVAVEEHAPIGWTDEAYAFLEAYLRAHAEMHVDDLWAAGMPEPREMRALGPLFKKATNRGLMAKSGRSKPSVRSHLSEKPIWTSLVCASERRAS